MKKILLIALLAPLIGTAQNKYHFKDTSNICIYTNTTADTAIKKPIAFDNLKQFFSSITMNANNGGITYENKENGRIIANFIEALSFKQGIGKEYFEIRYRVTADVKDGKFRYVIDNISLYYNTLMYGGKKIKTLEEESKSEDGRAIKRLTALDNELVSLGSKMSSIVTLKNTATNF